jgi:hypothetical protein
MAAALMAYLHRSIFAADVDGSHHRHRDMPDTDRPIGAA